MKNPKIKVLIADDNQSLSQQIKKCILENADFELVGITNDGEEEIRMIQNLKPNVVITDLKRKQGISGIEVIKRCYELEISETKFLVETARYYQEYFKELKKFGVNYILLKPFNLSDIEDEIYEIENERSKSLMELQTDIYVKSRVLKIVREKIKKILSRNTNM